MQSNVQDDRKFKQSCKYEGILQKRSKLYGYQDRHFVIRDNGNLLVYYKKNQQSSQNAVPQGFIYIGELEIEDKDANSKEFVIKIFKKVFYLRAKSQSDKTNWIKTLLYIKNYLQQLPDHNEKKQDFFNKANSGISNYWKKIDSEHLTKIKLEDEKLHTDDKVEDIKELNYQLLDIKGISEYTDQIEKSLIDDRLVSGFLWMKKDQVGAKLIQAKQRWLFLLTKNSVYSNEIMDEDQDVHERIDATKLPPWLDLNTIYYFTFDHDDITQDRSEKKGQISPDQIISVTQHELKHKNHNFLKKGFKDLQSGLTKGINKVTEITKLNKLGNLTIHSFQYGFELKIKTQEGKIETIHYFSEYITEINQWVAALRKILSEQQQEKILKQQKSENAQSDEEQFNENSDEENKKNSDTSSSESDSDDDYEFDDEEIFQQNNEWRKEIIKESPIKEDKFMKKLKSNKILQLKRQMITLFQDEKRILNQSKYMILKDILEVKDIDKKLKFSIKNNKGQEWKLCCKSQQDQKDWIYLINLLKNQEDILIENIFPDNQEKTDEILQLNKNNSNSNSKSNSKQNTQEYDENDIEQNGNQKRSQSLYTKYLNTKKQTEDPNFKIERTESYLKQFQIEEKQESFFKKLLCCACCQRKKKNNQNFNNNQKDINSQQHTQPLLDE